MFYILILFNVFVAVLAQMFLKMSANKKHPRLVDEYINVNVFIGYSLMSFSLLSNIFAMSNGVELKELGTIESLGYLFAPILSYVFFKEPITPKRIFSISLIVSGTAIFFVQL